VHTHLQSGLLFYLYNEFSFKVLNSFTGDAAAVSHALANTLKRVVILVWSSMALGEKLTVCGTVGVGLAAGGVYLFSLAKLRHGDCGEEPRADARPNPKEA
jgi:solute carrier family 35 protein E1